MHRYNPAFHRACEKARHRLIRLLFSAPSPKANAQGSQIPIPDLRHPFAQLSNRCEDAVIQLNPNGITHWGCVVFPGISRGRFQGAPQKRFCNAVVDERYMFRGLPLADDPQVHILRKRFQQGLSWKDSGGLALHAEYRRRTGDWQTSWTSFLNHQLKSWDRLFARIQELGYLSQAELLKHRKQPGRFGLFNEVEVCVNAKGKVLFLEGKHRLAMAQILGLPSIPVIVNLWSAGFLQQLRGPFTPALVQQYLQIASVSHPQPPLRVPESSVF